MSNNNKEKVGHYSYGQFEDLGNIGQGGFGIVRKVKDKNSNQIFALKMIKQINGELNTTIN